LIRRAEYLKKSKLPILLCDCQIARTNKRRTAPRSLDDIKRTLQQHKPELSEKWKVKSLGIFGSYVRGEAGKSSDLDVLVEIDDPKMGLLKFIA